MKDRDDLTKEVDGWDVISADATCIGKARGVVDGRWLEVVLDGETMGDLLKFQRDAEQQVNDRQVEVPPHGSEQLGDLDPTVGVNQTTEFLRPGPRQHAGEHPGAVPHDRRDNTNRYGDNLDFGPERHVLIPRSDVLRADRDTKQIFLRETRSSDTAALPPYREAEAARR
jgi:hypothetical protein